ncbi:hypothetical protein K7472_30360 [Streptomyces sp. PTM05]|uniref:Uncharacterized protein n=1 Tax=Streptantibioticus parmotrematis TaxID=2873249 RepID=A0ABS7R0X3_9ACTN|nr:hypothetical protein [Streptantibioticus parmotrematis]MBY8889116.1 hypothetical protein [Streptantibioticus parmotrematis]
METVAPRPGSSRTRLRFSATWSRTLCDRCLQGFRNEEEQVLAAFPAKLLRACGGHPPHAVYEVRRQLSSGVKVHRLVDRVERRWSLGWAHRPLRREADEETTAYEPADVALWLVAPTACRGGCEDGWDPSNPDRPCATCQPRTPHRPIVERSETAADMAATARQAARAAKSATTPGEYVPADSTEDADVRVRRVHALIEQKRTRKATERRPEISIAEEQADPVWAAALQRARRERRRPLDGS